MRAAVMRVEQVMLSRGRHRRDCGGGVIVAFHDEDQLGEEDDDAHLHKKQGRRGVLISVAAARVPLRPAQLEAHRRERLCVAGRQGRLNRSLMVCQDKFEAAKLQKMKSDATQELESCVNRSIDDSIRVLPHLVDLIKSSLSIN
jgi:hypothetical protein